MGMMEGEECVAGVEGAGAGGEAGVKGGPVPLKTSTRL